jgi:predicted metalloprotease with PDZ domain
MQIKRNPIAVVLPLALAACVWACPGSDGVALAQAARVRMVQILAGPAGRGAMGHGQHGFGSPSGSQGYLGIGFRDVSDDRLGALKLKESRGVEVLHVDHDGPASQAGLREHDVILQMNGQVIEGEEQLRRILHETPVGRSVTMVLSRDGQQITVTTQMADRSTVERQAWEQRYTITDPAPPPAAYGNGFIGGPPVAAPPITAPPDPHSHSFIGTVILGSSYTGAALELIGPQLAQFFGSQGGNGLLVRSVEPNSPAATAGMRAGDVVVRANAVVLTGVSDWYRLVRENKGRPVSVVIVRDKQEQTLVLIPDSKKRSSMEFQALPPSDAEQEQAQAIRAALVEMN